MKVFFSLVIFSVILSHQQVHGQSSMTKNIVIVTLDGYRWKELFHGPDPRILDHAKFSPEKGTTFASREQLMPFFWSTIAHEGQLYGNRKYKSKVNCDNNHMISYPGYSEMFVGFPDRNVSSNDKIENPNGTVLEFIHQQEGFQNQVVAFSTWDRFPYILREKKAGIYVNSAQDFAEGEISAVEQQLNLSIASLQGTKVLRSDSITFRYAMEYLKRRSPRVTLIAFDETDQHAHAGRYDEYLKAAHRADEMINELWQWIQSQPGYKDQTTLLITTDHGRGSGKRNWREHQLVAPGSAQIWFAVIGPDTPAFGEIKFKSRFQQKQIAKTIAAFLGLHYQNRLPVGEVVQTMISSPGLQGIPVSANTTFVLPGPDN
jgi:hypothetical protein